MARYARIQDDAVAELLDTDADIATLFPPSLQWVRAAADVAQGWKFSAGAFAPPPPPPPEDWQSDALARLRDMRDRLIEACTSMQADYQADGDTVNAKICKDIKAQLKVLESDSGIAGATTRAAFRTALRARLNAISSTAPLDVRDALKQAAAAA